MLSGMKSVICDWPGTQFQSCSSRSRKTLDYAQACRSDKGWRFFPLYGCGKNTTACPITWTGYVRPATINQAMGGETCFLLLQSHPARRLGYGLAGRTCSVQVGRGRRNQAALPYILPVIIPQTKHASSLATAATATFRFFPCLVNL